MITTTMPKRHPYVPHRAMPLADQAIQFQRGLYTVQRGERFAIPVDRLRAPTVFLNRDLWRRDGQGRVFRRGTLLQPRRFAFQKQALTWLRDHVHPEIPYWYYLATLGHDLHLSTWGELYGVHWHVGWANPFNPEQIDPPLDLSEVNQLPDTIAARRALRGLGGFTECLGFLSGGKVTTAFRGEEIDELVSGVGTEYADFDNHEVGLSTQAESNADTALITTTAIARVAGTPTDADPIYRTVGTITADTTETWQEHGVFNNVTGVALMDRSLTGGQSVASPDQVQYTYELTKNAEA